MQAISIMHLRDLLQCNSAAYAHVEQQDTGSKTTGEKNRTVTDETSPSSSLLESVKQKAYAIFSNVMEALRSFASFITSFGRTSSSDDCTNSLSSLFERVDLRQNDPLDPFSDDDSTNSLSSLFERVDLRQNDPLDPFSDDYEDAVERTVEYYEMLVVAQVKTASQ